MTRRVVVKVQRPLVTNGSEPQWLMYAKDRKNMQVLPESAVPAYVKNAMKEDFKAYFYGYFGVGGWNIGPRCGPQSW